MAALWIEKVTGSFDDKKKYKEYKARKAALPSPYRESVDALERYFNYYGAITSGELIVRMLDDLADLFETAAADGTSVRSIVGDDPVEFAEAFVRNYSQGQWIEKERTRLSESIDRAADQQS